MVLDAPEILGVRSAQNVAARLFRPETQFPCDGVVLNSYLGSDCIAPFLPGCREGKKSVFVAIRTANRSAPELQDLLAEQFSCDTGDLTRSTALEDLDADHEDMIELAWALGEAIGVEIDESELSEDLTIGELWRFVRDKEENAEE